MRCPMDRVTWNLNWVSGDRLKEINVERGGRLHCAKESLRVPLLIDLVRFLVLRTSERK